MKKLVWAKTIFESYKYIARIVRSIDRLVLERSIKSYSVGLGEPTTLEKMEIIIDLIQRKKRLLIIKMLIEESLKNIDKESARILIRYYIDKEELGNIAESLQQNKRTMMRHINKMLIEAIDKIADLGYDVDKIEMLLHNEGWIIGVYNKTASKFSTAKGIELLSVPANNLEKIYYRTI